MLGLASLLLIIVVSASVDPSQATRRPVTPSAPAAAAMTNADVVKMVKAGLTDVVIVAAIRNAARTTFRLDADALIALKSSGVSDVIVTAMFDPSAQPKSAASPATMPRTSASTSGTPTPAVTEPLRDAGIYVGTGDDERALVALEPTTFSQGKTGSVFTSAITYGIKKAKWKAIVRSATANIRITEPTPVFYFHFEQKGSGLSQTGGFAGWLSGASSPNEFVLAKMTAKRRERELIVGEFGLFGSSSGTRSKDTVDFRVEKVGPGVYKVTPSAPLEPGEYCFFYAAGASTFGAGTVGKLFDFGVDARSVKSP